MGGGKTREWQAVLFWSRDQKPWGDAESSEVKGQDGQELRWWCLWQLTLAECILCACQAVCETLSGQLALTTSP